MTLSIGFHRYIATRFNAKVPSQSLPGSRRIVQVWKLKVDLLIQESARLFDWNPDGWKSQAHVGGRVYMSGPCAKSYRDVQRSGTLLTESTGELSQGV
jgi:hypothetical protein